VFAIEEIIDLAIQIERNGEDVYRRAAAMASDPDVKGLLGWLADQEKEHVDWFSALRERVEVKTASEDLDAAAREILKTVLGGQAFSLADEDLGAKETVDEIMKAALEFEKDTIVFYEMIGEFVEEDEARQGLLSIIKEEEGHIKALDEHLDTIKAKTLKVVKRK
jgi:rubrerythrin